MKRVTAMLASGLLAACSSTHVDILGTYANGDVHGTAVTLRLLEGGKFEFCAPQCQFGKYKILSGGSEGRISFTGGGVSAFSRNLYDSLYGRGAAEAAQGPATDTLEFSYAADALSTRIFFEPGSEIELVKAK